MERIFAFQYDETVVENEFHEPKGGAVADIATTSLRIKSLGSPDEVRPFTDKGQVEIVNLEDVTVGRVSMEPGWKWSEHVKPIAGTESCQSSHTGYVLSGKMMVIMDDGLEQEIEPGDAFYIPAGHDAYTIGDESCVLVDISGMSKYAK